MSLSSIPSAGSLGEAKMLIVTSLCDGISFKVEGLRVTANTFTLRKNTSMDMTNRINNTFLNNLVDKFIKRYTLILITFYCLTMKKIFISIVFFTFWLNSILTSHILAEKQIYQNNFKAYKLGEETFVLSIHSRTKNTPVKQSVVPVKQTQIHKKAVDLLKKYNSPLVPYVAKIYTTLPKSKADMLIAISLVESSGGTKGYIAENCFNAWGYLYVGTSRRGCYSPKWDSWEHSIERFAELEKGNYLAGKNLAVYCQSTCTYWFDNLNYFLEVLE